VSDVRIGLLGCGTWGMNWLRAIDRARGARLVHVADLSAAALAAARERAPDAALSEGPAALLADPAVDAVVVATPTATHHPLARAALLAGKDVLVEKPLATRAADAAELAALARARGRVLLVGHLLLFHPAVEHLASVVREGALGDVHYLHAQRLNLGVIRRDESAWTSLAPHDVAIANHLFGGPPTTVGCTGGAFVQPRRADVVFATLTYPKGRLAHVHVSWLDPHKIRRLTIVGSKKMATFDDTSPDEKVAIFDRGVDPPPSLAWGEGLRVRTGAITIPPIAVCEPLVAECEALADAVRARRAPARVAPSAALDVVRVLEAGERSLAQGGAPVALADTLEPT
jgi:predicted dehydrogenase